jgi:hypothetical protein
VEVDRPVPQARLGDVGGGEHRVEADPAALALATLAALQGGLLLTQMRRDTQPLETALDAMLTLIASLTTPPPLPPSLRLGRCEWRSDAASRSAAAWIHLSYT